MNITKLENTCKYLQRNDRNGDYLEMIKEYNQGELPIEVIHEVCLRVLTEWKEEHLSEEDVEEKQELQKWINYITN